jgi:4-amino-4-deoxy-L-arabinose transferase-like glycosyltransferase
MTSIQTPRDGARPWYRREPWLAVILVAFVPVLVGFATPQHFHMPLMALSALLTLTALALLIRQGPFRPRE